VREVAVHLQDELSIAREHPIEAREVRAADPLLRRAVEDVEPRKLPCEAVGDLARAVGRSVVDDEHAIAARVEHVAERAHERLDVVPLVVGRDADDCACRAHRRSLPAPVATGSSL